MNEDPQFYKTNVSFDILSQEPVTSIGLYNLLSECISGNMVLGTRHDKEEKITPKQMSEALYDAGSEPSFFYLTDEGEFIEGDEED